MNLIRAIREQAGAAPFNYNEEATSCPVSTFGWAARAGPPKFQQLALPASHLPFKRSLDHFSAHPLQHNNTEREN